MAGPFRVVFLGFVASFFCVGLYDFLTNIERNKCEMTYMYENPEYLQVPLSKKVKEKFPTYNLAIYGEGEYSKQLKKSKLDLHGIPVLFIPGSSGSVAQVRSLGSVALQMAADYKLPYHFNYFSIDYNEEFSALYGGVLWKQTEFAHHCIKRILNLYKNAQHKPKSVIIVGHSMGGIIARGLFALPTFDADLVTTIITQATPNHPPIPLDNHVQEYYQYVNDYWKSHVNTTLKYVVVLSTAGGYRDLLVRAGLTSLKNIYTDERSLSTNTMATPLAWASTDHLCHVWCRQTVLSTQRALIDMIDKSAKQVAVSVFYRMSVLRHHFLHNPGPKNFVPAYDETVKLDPGVKWEVRKKMSWKFTREKLNSTRYSVMPLLKDPTQGTAYGVTIVSNIENVHWIGACILSAKQEKCESMTNFAPLANLIPPRGSAKKALIIHPEQLQKFTHLVVELPKRRKRTEVIAEQYNMTNRNIRYVLPGLSTIFVGYKDSDVGPDMIVEETETSATYYNISIDGLNNVMDTYTLHVIVRSCPEKHSKEHTGTVVRFHVPWSSEDSYTFIKYGESGNISAKLQNAKPPGYPKNAEVHVFLHPGCTYTLTITRSWMEMFGQFVRNYTPLLPCFFVIQILMTLSWQLKQLDEEGIASSFAVSHAKYAQPWRVVPLALILRFVFCYPDNDSFANRLGLPPDDILSLTTKGLWLTPIPIFLYLTAYAITELHGYVLYGMIAAFSRVFGLIFDSCIHSFKIVKFCTLIEYLVLIGAAVLAGTVCGSLGLLIVYLVHLGKLVINYNWAKRQEETFGDWVWNRFNVNFSLFLLTLMMFILNAPSLVMWGKNIRYSMVLENDPSRWTGVALALATLFLTYSNFPLIQTELYGVLSGIYYISSILMVIYTMESVYRIPYFVAANLLNLALPLVIISAMSAPRRAVKPSQDKELEDKEDMGEESEEEEMELEEEMEEEEEETEKSDKKND